LEKSEEFYALLRINSYNHLNSLILIRSYLYNRMLKKFYLIRVRTMSLLAFAWLSMAFAA